MALVSTLSYFNEPERGMGLYQTDVVKNDELRKFFDAVLQAIPGTYLVRKGPLEAFVCHPRSPITLGTIGRSHVLGGIKFTVQSQNIHNARFAAGSANRNRAASGDMAVAVRNAKKFLLLHNPHQMAHEQVSDVATIMRATFTAYRTKRDAAHRIFSSDQFRDAVGRMLEAGFTFDDAELQEKMEAYYAADREVVKASADRKMVFVHVTEDWRGQIMQVVSMSGAGGIGLYSLAVMNNAPAQDHLVADIQPDTLEYLILGRVSVLSLVPNRTYVEGVGVKTTENTYYVEV